VSIVFCYSALVSNRHPEEVNFVIKPLWTTLCVVSFVLPPAFAQTEAPEWELGGSYQFERFDINAVQKLANALTVPNHLPTINVGSGLNTNGFSASIQENKASWWGGIVEVDGSYATERINLSPVAQSLGLVAAGTPVTATFRPSLYTVAGGPQFTYRRAGKVQPFLRIMGGAAHANLSPDPITQAALKDSAPTFATSNTSQAILGGIGADYAYRPWLSIRAVADYSRTYLFQEHQSNVRLNVGLVYRFSGK
jgi:hypothetical protein